MEDGDKRRMIESYIRAFNYSDTNGMAALMHTQCIYEDMADGTPSISTKGILEFRELNEQARQMFSSRSLTAIEFKYETGDVVTVETIYSAVIKNDTDSGLKAGEVIKINGRSVFEFRDNVIYKLTDYYS
jgi:hypothetical protein